MPSLCDQCYAPGACCKKIKFYGQESTPHNEVTFWHDTDIVKQIEDDARFSDLPDGKSPFVVAELGESYTDDESGRPFGYVTFNCSQLSPDGRCLIYDKRPLLCQIFEPASDLLCVHYKGAESGDPTVQ